MNFQLLRQGLDVAPLVEQIEAQPELWNTQTMRTTFDGTSHGAVDDIWVRYNAWDRFDPENPQALAEEHVPVWYPAWHALPALKPLVFGMMAAFYGEMLGGVLITRVPPGKKILPHADRGWHVEYYDKLYLSLKSAPGANFVCRDALGAIEISSPRPGDLYLFDNRLLHWVTNDSDEDRMTLIVCLRTELWGRK